MDRKECTFYYWKIWFCCSFDFEKLFDLYPFDLKQLENDLQSDFIPYKEGKNFFFTKAMAEEYIAKTIVKCVKEIDSLRNGSFVIDEEEYAWNVL